MASGYRVTATIRIGGREFSNTALVTDAQAGDPATRAKIKAYLERELIRGIVTELGEVQFTITRELDVSAFTVDPTGAAKDAETDPA